MRAKKIVTCVGCAVLGGLAIAGTWNAPVAAQGSHASHQQGSSGQKDRAGALVRAVREATERYRDPAVADADGYKLMFGCVSGSDSGAMGLHYVNASLLDAELDPQRPEIVIYEPLPDGRLRLIGADFLVFADVWHQANGAATPELMGQLLHLFESPNRFGLPAFYTLHVWAWKENPNGAFVNWHPKVSCEAFPG